MLGCFDLISSKGGGIPTIEQIESGTWTSVSISVQDSILKDLIWNRQRWGASDGSYQKSRDLFFWGILRDSLGFFGFFWESLGFVVIL